jgi:glyoxylase-like metal-dependent hydrolase (beta-lactamase superfamily II)
MKIVKFGLSLFGVNMYLIVDPETKECAVIDPGISDKLEQKALTDYINREGLLVTKLINTHLHIDHAFGNDFVVSTFGVKVMANELDAPLGERIVEQARMFCLNDSPKEIKIDKYLHDGDEINVGNGILKVLHVPGHSRGSIVLYDEIGGYIISGDVLFANSIGRTDLPGGDYDTLINGIKNKLLTLPANTIVYPGHGDPTTIGYEAHNNPYLV